MILSGKYEILHVVCKGPIETYEARHRALGYALMVHFLRETLPGQADSVVKAIEVLPPGDRDLFLDMGEYQGIQYLVSRPLSGFKNLLDWLGGRGADKKDQGQRLSVDEPIGEFTQYFSGGNPAASPPKPAPAPPPNPPADNAPLFSFDPAEPAPPQAAPPQPPASAKFTDTSEFTALWGPRDRLQAPSGSAKTVVTKLTPSTGLPPDFPQVLQPLPPISTPLPSPAPPVAVPKPPAPSSESEGLTQLFRGSSTTPAIPRPFPPPAPLPPPQPISIPPVSTPIPNLPIPSPRTPELKPSWTGNTPNQQGPSDYTMAVRGNVKSGIPASPNPPPPPAVRPGPMPPLPVTPPPMPMPTMAKVQDHKPLIILVVLLAVVLVGVLAFVLYFARKG